MATESGGADDWYASFLCRDKIKNIFKFSGGNVIVFFQHFTWREII